MDLTALQEELSRLPKIRRAYSIPSSDNSADVILELASEAGEETQLRVQCKSHTYYPRDVAQLRSQAHQQLLVAAPSISPGAKELLRDQGIGYWDPSGNLSLQLPWGYYLLDRPTLPAPKRKLRSLYTGQKARVLHTLLMHSPDRQWLGSELADLAEVSPYTVHQVLEYLEEEIWMVREGRGPKSHRSLVAPGKLLEAWAAVHHLRAYTWRRFYVLPPGLEKVPSILEEQLGSQHGATLELGSLLSAPYAPAPDCWMFLVPPTNWEELAQANRWRPVDEGENLVLLETRDTAPLMYTQTHGAHGESKIRVASPIQLYLDLANWQRRGKERAQHLRQTVLKF